MSNKNKNNPWVRESFQRLRGRNRCVKLTNQWDKDDSIPSFVMENKKESCDIHQSSEMRATCDYQWNLTYGLNSEYVFLNNTYSQVCIVCFTFIPQSCYVYCYIWKILLPVINLGFWYPNLLCNSQLFWAEIHLQNHPTNT